MYRKTFSNTSVNFLKIITFEGGANFPLSMETDMVMRMIMRGNML